MEKGCVRTCLVEAEPRVCLAACRGWRTVGAVLVVAGRAPVRTPRWRVPWAGPRPYTAHSWDLPSERERPAAGPA